MTAVLDKLERFAQIAERFEGLAKTLPRLAEMFGVALFAGRASERLGGQFVDGAIGGMVADGLAHSQLPNNQVGGIALGTYFAALSLLTIAPEMGELSPDRRVVTSLTREECAAQGGIWLRGLGVEGCSLPKLGE